jgi:hypothetical protein
MRGTKRGIEVRTTMTKGLSLVLLLLIAGSTIAAEPRKASFFGKVYPRISMAVGYELDAAWPIRTGTDLPPWGGMSGVAVDAQDQVWTFNRGPVPIQVFSPDGSLVHAWGEGLFGKPHHLRIDGKGNVWISDTGKHVVQKFTNDGRLLLTLGTPGHSGADATHFNQPTDIAVTPQGQVFVTDGYGNNRVVHFDATGRFVGEWGRLGVGVGEFSLPHAIALDSRGRLYVADRNNARIQVFNQSGEWLDEWRNLIVPWHIWITPRDEVYVCGSTPMRWGGLALPGMVLGVPPKDQIVIKFSTSGRAEELWSFPLGKAGDCHPGELCWVHGLAVDSRGNLYLGDIQGRHIQKFRRAADPRSPAPNYAGRPRRDDAVQKTGKP